MIGMVTAYTAPDSDNIDIEFDAGTYYAAPDSDDIDLVLIVSDTTPPDILWISPTPDDGNITWNNWVYLNTTITDDYDTSAFFDWNYSLKGYWSMEFSNASGIFGNSTHNNFGWFNTTTEADQIIGKYGNAFNFSGVKDFIDAGNDSSLIIVNEITIDLWVNPQPGQEECFSVGRDNGNYGILGSVNAAEGTLTWSYQLRYGAPELCSLGFQLNTVAGGKWVDVGTNLTTDEWTHLVMTFNGTTIKLYVNGLLNETNHFASTTISVNTNNKLLIGHAGWGESNTYYNGSIDELKIHDRAISQEEVNASYNNNLYRLNHNFTGLANGLYNYSAYAIDTSGNLNITIIRNVTIDAVTDTCTAPGSGIWEVNCADYCNITSDVNIGVERIVLAGTGSFTILAEVMAGSIAIDPNCALHDISGDAYKLKIRGG